MKTATRLALLGAALAVAGCGGGKGGASSTPVAAAPRAPDASLSITIQPSTNIGHATSGVARSPRFLDPVSGATISLQFQTFNGSTSNLSTSVNNVPVTSTATTISAPVYSGVGFASAQEFDGQGRQIAVSNGTFYQLDPGTTETFAMTLSLVPASVVLTTSPSLSTATDANKACITVNASQQSIKFALLPADADGTFQKVEPVGQNGVGSPVTLTNIVNGNDGNGGTSTIVSTTEAWNGYPVYNFVYTPAPGTTGTKPAPAVKATASTPNPQGGTFTESVTITPGTCSASA